jgi:hypothetical protein
MKRRKSLPKRWARPNRDIFYPLADPEKTRFRLGHEQGGNDALPEILSIVNEVHS